MHQIHHRTAQIETRYHRDGLAEMLAAWLPQIRARAEGVALYALVVSFWGLVLYLAAVYGL